MSRRERIAAFEAWLKVRGNPSELALFNRSVVDGLLSITGGRKVEPEHVDRAVALARDSGMADTSGVVALGALLLEYETVGDAAPAPEPTPRIRAASEHSEQELFAEVAEPAPLTVKLRAAEPASANAPASVAPDLADEPAPAPPSRKWIGYVAGVAAIAALALIGFSLRGHSAATHAPTVAKDGPVRLRRVPLTATVPAGWHEASDAELQPMPAGATPMSLVFRNGTAADPDRGMFVAVLPAARELVGHPADAALISAASTAERGLGAAVTHGAGQYASAGCTVVALGGVRTAACVGSVQEAGAKSEVATFVRVIADREIVAVCVTRPPSAAASAENEALVASLVP